MPCVSEFIHVHADAQPPTPPKLTSIGFVSLIMSAKGYKQGVVSNAREHATKTWKPSLPETWWYRKVLADTGTRLGRYLAAASAASYKGVMTTSQMHYEEAIALILIVSLST